MRLLPFLLLAACAAHPPAPPPSLPPPEQVRTPVTPPPPRPALPDCWDGHPCEEKPGFMTECYVEGQVGLCGPPGCDIMQKLCGSVAQCAEGEACLPSPRARGQRMCSPMPCSDDAACGSPNLACSRDRFCYHRPCRTNADCRGYCVHGGCYTGPGYCVSMQGIPM